jgi:RHH-type proline utilization regulon transcriptional repressor/proline dehydrogenase/delta 1-pyrroline-5-carboxylate dehydrogenase
MPNTGAIMDLTEYRNEAPLDFSTDEARELVKTGIAAARARMPYDCPLIIDGKDAKTEATITSENPSQTSETVGRSASATVADADRAIEAARRGFAEWSRVPVDDRAAILQRWAQLMRDHRGELIGIEILEAGKPWREADADVCEAIDFLEYYALESIILDEPEHLQPHLLGEVNEYGYTPLGVVAVIAPWNFPLAIPTGMVAAALATGNTVVFKPAEQTPVIGRRMVELALEAGVPARALHYLPGVGEEIGPRLVRHPEVDMIVFTGSRAVGTLIAREAAEHPARRGLKRVVTEMGGKNALVIDADADLDVAVPDLLASAFGFSGQKCSACSRVYALESVAERLYRRMAQAAESYVIGPAEEPLTQVGPVIDADSKKRIENYIQQGYREGTVIFQANVEKLAKKGHFVAPAIFVDMKPEHRVMSEEIFGPVLGCAKVATLDEAFERVNATDYALTGGIHTRTPSHAVRARREMMVGNLYINRGITGAIVGRQPFGGFRFSGVGSKAGGPDYLKQFLVARTWTENIVRQGFAPIPAAERDGAGGDEKVGAGAAGASGAHR